MIRVVLPQHLRTLARVGAEVEVRVSGQPTVRSVLDTLGTTDVRRVKLGIGRPEGGRRDVPDHVLSAFDPDELDTMSAAVAAAADRVLTLAQTPSTR